MSLSSTSTIKGQLTMNLGPKAPQYFSTLKAFVSGKISRQEFDDRVRQVLDSTSLIQLHNALIISLFDATAVLKRPPTPPPPPAPKPPPRKRRRLLLPYQGPQTSEDARTLRSMRIKRWTLLMGKRERERILSIQNIQSFIDPPPARPELDEIDRERGVLLLPERGDFPGTRVGIQLHSITHAPTVQHITDRINLICAQNNLSAPSRTVSSLMNLACEAKLKQLITHAITLTSTSHAITSITPSSSSLLQHPHHPQSKAPILTTSSFQTLFTISPADLPYKSATAMRLALSPSLSTHEACIEEDHEDLVVLKDHGTRDHRWQLMALLAERSSMRDNLRGIR
ncbi:hypothetical protein AMATHDRAFT_74582 [Amanita thiersii Skay4041]|uniref:Uncharacterized protein n=1 Tax=Amanita thiersii Skay4041 TaxID=703135 RepID=A0A2A9NRC9_9AGAR|nr:hypothetical protein AMATHDRAFT_74582 [Amanita thiersii Skay4041]